MKRSEEYLSKLGPALWLVRDVRHAGELERESTSPGPEEAGSISFPRAVRKPSAGRRALALEDECPGHPPDQVCFGR